MCRVVVRWRVGGSEVAEHAAAAAVAGCNSAADWSIKLRNLWALTVRARRSTVDWCAACVSGSSQRAPRATVCAYVCARDRVFSFVKSGQLLQCVCVPCVYALVCVCVRVR